VELYVENEADHLKQIKYNVYRAMVRNSNSVSVDVTLITIRTMLVSALCRQFGSCFGLFDIAG
jgi:hypothetical protein